MSLPARKLLIGFVMIKARLREIASSSALRDWARSCPTSTFAGVCRVETQHATYLFRNGSCFAGTRKGHGAGTETELVGMRIVGWLLPEGEKRADKAPPGRAARPADQVAGTAATGVKNTVEVSRTWRAGARAVLTSKGRLFTGPRTALTSPVTSFAQFADASEARPRPPSQNLAAASLTRVRAAAPV